jgi:two-component system, LuxR family, response regulator FixJ
MTETINIALVDDDAAVLDSLGLYFARRHVTTARFASAEAFLTSFDGGAPPECIVSDIRMPRMSGLDLVHRVKERRSAAPLILITAVADIEMAVSAIKKGASTSSKSRSTKAAFLPASRLRWRCGGNRPATPLNSRG